MVQLIKECQRKAVSVLEESLCEIDNINNTYGLNLENDIKFEERYKNWRRKTILKLKDISKSFSSSFKQKFLSRNIINLKEHMTHDIQELKILLLKVNQYPEEVFDLLSDEILSEEEKWNTFFQEMHPKVVKVSKKLFLSKHYSNASLDAFKELECEVRKIYKKYKGKEKQGLDLMMQAFDCSNGVIKLSDDLDSNTGKNTQEGYKFIFAGSMTGIRNPKAHQNIVIDARSAIHHLYIASLLFFMLDQRVAP